jgi:hypothetical protein
MIQKPERIIGQYDDYFCSYLYYATGEDGIDYYLYLPNALLKHSQYKFG